MLESFEKNRVPITTFLSNHKPRANERTFSKIQDKLEDLDWDEIHRFIKLLKVFEQTTKYAEGNSERAASHGSLWEIIPILQALYDHLHKAKAKYEKKPDSYFKSGIKLGIEKLNTYFKEAVYDSPYYCAAAMLHPGLNQSWFKDRWRAFPTWIKKAESQFQTLYMRYEQIEQEAYVAKEPPAQDIQQQSQTEERTQRPRKRRRLSISSFAESESKSESSADEFDMRNIFKIDSGYSDHGQFKTPEAEAEWKSWFKFRPLAEDTYEIDPRKWWIDELQENPRRFPILSRMALDLFSCPAMSAECERVFSRAKRTITVDRNSLSHVTIQANECQKDWLQKKLVQSMLPRIERQALLKRLQDEEQAIRTALGDTENSYPSYDTRQV
jgi:hypothetical protein